MQLQNEHTSCEIEEGCQYKNNTQKTGKPDTCNGNTNDIQNSNNEDFPTVIDSINSKINCFIPAPKQKVDKRTSTKPCNSYIEFSAEFLTEARNTRNTDEDILIYF